MGFRQWESKIIPMFHEKPCEQDFHLPFWQHFGALWVSSDSDSKAFACYQATWTFLCIKRWCLTLAFQQKPLYWGGSCGAQSFCFFVNVLWLLIGGWTLPTPRKLTWFTWESPRNEKEILFHPPSFLGFKMLVFGGVSWLADYRKKPSS